MKAGLVRVAFHSISFVMLIMFLEIDVEKMGILQVGSLWMVSMIVYDLGNFIADGMNDD